MTANLWKENIVATTKTAFGRIETADDEFPRERSAGRPAKPLNEGVKQAIEQSMKVYAETEKHLKVSFATQAEVKSFLTEAERVRKALNVRFNKTTTPNEDGSFTVRFYAVAKDAPELEISSDE